MESVTNSSSCGVNTTLDIIGGKWKILIIYHLLDTQAPMRFSALRRSINGITEKMLTSQLRDLESKGLVERKVYPVVPPHVEYSLTLFGRSLHPILHAMDEWGSGFNTSERMG
jgi:DNA-binding HxlR family transcriptional regulator